MAFGLKYWSHLSAQDIAHENGTLIPTRPQERLKYKVYSFLILIQQMLVSYKCSENFFKCHFATLDEVAMQQIRHKTQNVNRKELLQPSKWQSAPALKG